QGGGVGGVHQLAGGVHRQQRRADVHGADAEPGGGQRTDRGPARHRVVGDELLVRGAGGSSEPGDQGGTGGVGGVALVGVDLQQHSPAGRRLVRRVVPLRVVRVHSVPAVGGQAPGGGVGLPLLGPAGTQGLPDPGEHIVQDRAGGTRTGLRAELFVVEGGQHADVVGTALVRGGD